MQIEASEKRYESIKTLGYTIFKNAVDIETIENLKLDLGKMELNKMKSTIGQDTNIKSPCTFKKFPQHYIFK